MANLSQPSFDYRASPSGPVWGFPAGSSIVDLVLDDMKDVTHPHWKKFPPVNPMWHYLFAIIYIFLGITSVTGNSLVLHIFSKTKELRTPANLFVMNLAFSDLCMMLTQFPPFVHSCFSGGVWHFGPFACELYAFFGGLFGMTSICTMAAISYDRYNVIVNGMSGTRMTTKRAVLLILFCWVYSGFWNATPFLGWGRYIPEGLGTECSFDYLTRDQTTVTYVTCIFFFDYCVPLMIILFCYYHIVQAIFAHEKALREQAKKMNVTSLRSNADQNAQSAEMRIAKVAMLNISLWVVMWTPYVVICLQGIYGNQDKITPLVTVLPAIIAKASSISNPIIYAISHPKYRLALQKQIPWFCINEKQQTSDNQSSGSGTTTATE